MILDRVRYFLKRYKRWIVGVILTPPLLVTLLAVALYLPPVQDWAVGVAERRLSESLGMTVEIGQLRLSPMINLRADEVRIVRAEGDTLASLGKLELGLSVSVVWSGRIAMARVSARDLYYHHTDSLGTDTEVRLGRLDADEFSLVPSSQTVYVSSLRLGAGRVRYVSTDSTASPESAPLLWQITADELLIEDTALDLRLPHQAVIVAGEVDRLRLEQSEVDLEHTNISIGTAELLARSLKYQTDERPPAHEYLDPNHIALRDISLGLQGVVYDDGDLALEVVRGELSERSGLSVRLLRGAMSMDSLGLRLKNLALQTEYSSLYGRVSLPWLLLEGVPTAELLTQLEASVHLEDVRMATGQSFAALLDRTTEGHLGQVKGLTTPINLSVSASGSLSELALSGTTLVWEEVVDMTLDGRLYDLHDLKRRRGTIDLEVGMQTYARTLLSVAGASVAETYNIPNGLVVKGKLSLGGGMHHLDLKGYDRDARLTIDGQYNELTKQYRLGLVSSGVNLGRYILHQGLGVMDAELQAHGRGMDPLSPYTNANLTARITRLDYGGRTLTDLTADGKLSRGELAFALNSFNPGLSATLLVDGLLSRQRMSTNLVFDSEEIDLVALGLSDSPLSVRMRLNGELRSDLKESHQLEARITDMNLTVGSDTLRPEEVGLSLSTTPMRSKADLTSGDLRLHVDAGVGYTSLSKHQERLSRLATQLWHEVQSTQPMRMRLEDLLAEVPQLNLDLELGRDNALAPLLAGYRWAVDRAEGHVRLGGAVGLEGNIALRGIRQDTTRINCITLDLSTERYPRVAQYQTAKHGRQGANLRSTADSMMLRLEAQIDKQSWRRQEGFVVSTQIRTSLQELTLGLEVMDASGRSEHSLGLMAGWDGDTYRLSIPHHQIRLAYQTLGVNEDNFIHIRKSNLLARAALMLSDGARPLLGLSAHDMDGAGQEAGLVVHRLNLGDYRRFGLPDISGRLSADIKYSRPGGWSEQAVVTGDLSVQELHYDGKRLGHFATALFYEPRNDQSHYLTAELSYEGKPALSLDAIYYPAGEASRIKGEALLSQFPLEIANPFLAPYATYLGGYASGRLGLSGALSAPDIEGEVVGSSASLELRNYATTLRLDTIPLRLEESALRFDHYAIYSGVDAERPIYIDGRIQTVGDKAMEANLRVHTDETTLIDQPSPDDEHQLVYGKLIAAADLSVSGRLSTPRVRGRLDILGGTNCTYIMRESTLDASDHSQGLVSYVDFADTLFVPKRDVEAELGGMDMSIAISLDPAVRFGVDLTSDGADYVRMHGGGAMQLRYPPFGQMSLTGRYEMVGGGSMHYTMPVVGGKRFSIDPSSYIRFDGDVANPYVHLGASQTVRASAGTGQGNTTFKVGIHIKDYVEQMNLSFTLEAPEDLSIQNDISMMTAEEQSKQAIGLLATGTYLAAGGNGFDGALTSLLQGQLNALAGSLLRGTDLSLGMEMGEGASGNYTNYTYSFSRRFYNDRIRIIVGGKIQTGNAVSTRDRSLIDNVSLEYQLDRSGEHYVQLYHKLVTDNVLDGEYTETGAGYLMRRKLQRLTDLFDFRRRPKQIVQPADSLKTTQVDKPQAWSLPTDTTTR